MHTDNALRWQARPLLAATTKGVALALPVALSAGAAYFAARLVPPPGSLRASVVWWIALSGGATAVLVVAGRLTRRLLPLAGLMRLSLVFPDCAPSRFDVAMRTGTLETLEQRLAAARNGWHDVAPADAARRLLELVAMLDTHDRLTRGHSERVRAYAQAIGRELGLERRDLDLLNWAALLHDIGKLEVPDAILTKNGKPSPEEWAILQRHPELGDALIGPLREWLGDWSAAVVEHHERWDGGGYPRGLAGAEISLAGRIVAVADVFDVITSTRSYKEAFTPSEAREEITRGAGTQFDPEVVRAFLAMSVRRSRSSGALAWLAQAPVLGKVVLVPAATTVSAAAVGLGLGTPHGDPKPKPALAAAPTVHASDATMPSAAGTLRSGAAVRRQVSARAGTHATRAERAVRRRPTVSVMRPAPADPAVSSAPPSAAPADPLPVAPTDPVPAVETPRPAAPADTQPPVPVSHAAPPLSPTPPPPPVVPPPTLPSLPQLPVAPELPVPVDLPTVPDVPEVEVGPISLPAPPIPPLPPPVGPHSR